MTGPSDDPRPVNHVLPAWDLLTGAYAAFALVTSLLARQTTGEGREVRIPLSDVAASTVANLGMVAETLQRGRQRQRTGNDLFGAFGRDFTTHDGVRIMVVAITPRQWQGLLKALGLAEVIADLRLVCAG
jgi:2-methylfumaryl-CoA isomerase